MDGSGRPVGREEFRCAPGPAGWRWFSTIQADEPTPHEELVDYVVDASWRPVRLRIDSGAHQLLIASDRGAFRGMRDGQPIELPLREDLDYLSPSFNAVTANRLGGTGEIEVVYFDPVTLEPSLMPQRYEFLGEEIVETPVGSFETRAWRYTALGSGWSRPLWVAGDIVVAYEDVFELSEYEPGPNGPFPAGSDRGG